MFRRMSAITLAALFLTNCTAIEAGSRKLAKSAAGSRELSSFSADLTRARLGQEVKVVDSSYNGYIYTYAPSIIYAEGQYHAYFCSAGTGVDDWDHVRHATSSDLVNWSETDTLITSMPVERANCDPSVIRFDRGDGPYYYMVYSGNAWDVQTLNFVARSASPTGPWLKYTERGTWEWQPEDVHPIIWPFQNKPEGSNAYGAGQASLVVRGKTVYQWYTDTTHPSHEPASKIYLVQSTDMVHWSAPQATNVMGASVDVKWDAEHGRYVMFEILDSHQPSSRLALRTSKDGLTWSEPKLIGDQNAFPDWSHNVGVSGNDQGHLSPDGRLLVAFGAPYDNNPDYDNDCQVARGNCWGNWDLMGVLLDLE